MQIRCCTGQSQSHLTWEPMMIWRDKSAFFAALFAALVFVASAGAADDANSLLQQGDGYLKDRNLPAAVDAYRKAAALKPDLESAYHGLITALSDGGKLEEAMKVSEETVRR